MPRFYFDIRDGESFVPDEDGLDFPTINEARDDASRTLGQMMKEAMAEWRWRSGVPTSGPCSRCRSPFDVEALAKDVPVAR